MRVGTTRRRLAQAVAAAAAAVVAATGCSAAHTLSGRVDGRIDRQSRDQCASALPVAQLAAGSGEHLVLVRPARPGDRALLGLPARPTARPTSTGAAPTGTPTAGSAPRACLLVFQRKGVKAGQAGAYTVMIVRVRHPQVLVRGDLDRLPRGL